VEDARNPSCIVYAGYTVAWKCYEHDIKGSNSIHLRCRDKYKEAFFLRSKQHHQHREVSSIQTSISSHTIALDRQSLLDLSSQILQPSTCSLRTFSSSLLRLHSLSLCLGTPQSFPRPPPATKLSLLPRLLPPTSPLPRLLPPMSPLPRLLPPTSPLPSPPRFLLP
jgi:hypothetical protein